MHKVLNMIEEFLSDKYDALEFSYDLPDYLILHYDKLERENKVANDILNNNIPEICAEYEIEQAPDEFKSKIREEYEKLKLLL